MAVRFRVCEGGDHSGFGIGPRAYRSIEAELTRWFESCGVEGNLTAKICRGTSDGHASQPKKAIRFETYAVYVRVQGCFIWVVVPDSLGLTSGELFNRLCAKNQQTPQSNGYSIDVRLTPAEIGAGRKQHAVINFAKLITYAKSVNDSFFAPYAEWLIKLYYLAVQDEKARITFAAAESVMRGPAEPWRIIEEMYERKIILSSYDGAIFPGMEESVHIWLAPPTVIWVEKIVAEFHQQQSQRARSERQSRVDQRVKAERSLVDAQARLELANQALRDKQSTLSSVKQQVVDRAAEIEQMERSLVELKRQQRHAKGQIVPKAESDVRRANEEITACQSRVAALERELGKGK